MIQGPKTRLPTLIAITLAVPTSALCQTANNSYSQVLMNNSYMQSNLTNQMINLGGRPTSGSGAPICDPPLDLIRANGRVPPQSQGDPRYQAYLHCRYGDAPITFEMANAQALPVRPAAGSSNQPASAGSQASPQVSQSAPALAQQPVQQHLPITATDFIPVQPGHPIVAQQLASLPIAPVTRANVEAVINTEFTYVAQNFRANNLAVAICVAYTTTLFTLNGQRFDTNQMHEFILNENDLIARGPRFAQMSDVDKQNTADIWIFETAMLNMLRASGQQGNTQDGQQAMQLAQGLLQQLNAL